MVIFSIDLIDLVLYIREEGNKKVIRLLFYDRSISILQYAISYIYSIFIMIWIIYIYTIHVIGFTFLMPWWWNGRHARLKISCLRAWRFESSSRHNIFHVYWMSDSMANIVWYSLNRLGWDRFPSYQQIRGIPTINYKFKLLE